MRVTILLAAFLMPAAALAGSLDDGLHAMVAGDYTRAEASLRCATSERPRDPIAHFNLASALRSLGRGDEALAEYQTALDLSRDDTVRGDTLYGIALTRDTQGNPALSQQAWRNYISFAQRDRTQQPSVAIAERRLADAERLAAQPPLKIPGTQKAGR
jgi:Flp pilus assembly protein TadD